MVRARIYGRAEDNAKDAVSHAMSGSSVDPDISSVHRNLAADLIS